MCEYNMRLAAVLLLLGILTASDSHGQSRKPSAKSDAIGVANSLQMLVVTAKDWDDLHAVGQRYERSKLTANWHAVGGAFPVVVGKTGLGWGLGIQPRSPSTPDGPVKHEGDGKAPAGIFEITSSFGYSPKPLPYTKLPYLALTPTVECVDDPNSSHYNQLFDAKDMSKNWKSSERMRRDDELYRWGALVAHNSDPPLSGGGSCIFLHIWSGPDQGTVGCTAMEQRNIESLLKWFDPAKHPVLVQLPRAEYSRYGATWFLPPNRALPR